MSKVVKNSLVSLATAKPAMKMPAVKAAAGKPVAMKPGAKRSAISNLGKYAHAPARKK